MNETGRAACLAAIVVVAAGCYHATIDTGLPNSNEVIDKRWAAGWVFGLVPPKTVEAAAACPDGVAQVETKLGFLNQVVGVLTIGIYTPMHIRVTCAASIAASRGLGEPEVSVAQHASTADIVGAFSIAAEEAVASGKPVYVRFAAD